MASRPSRPELVEKLEDDRRFLGELIEQRERLPDKQRRDRDVFEERQRDEAAELDAAIDRCRAAIVKTERLLQEK